MRHAGSVPIYPVPLLLLDAGEQPVQVFPAVEFLPHHGEIPTRM
jgi:hypothetical protein